MITGRINQVAARCWCSDQRGEKKIPLSLATRRLGIVFFVRPIRWQGVNVYPCPTIIQRYELRARQRTLNSKKKASTNKRTGYSLCALSSVACVSRREDNISPRLWTRRYNYTEHCPVLSPTQRGARQQLAPTRLLEGSAAFLMLLNSADKRPRTLDCCCMRKRKQHQLCKRSRNSKSIPRLPSRFKLITLAKTTLRRF